MNKQSFLKGALLLVLANVFVKFGGFLYQILIIRLISPEGIGIFNLIFPLYISVLVFTTAGLPPAVSKFVATEIAAGNKNEAVKIFRTAFSILFFAALLITLLVIFFAYPLTKFLYTDPRVLPAFLFLLPTLPVVSIAAIIKGFFQGLQNMRPTAFSQLLEQFIRISSGLCLLYFLRPHGLTWTAVGLSVAVFLSEVGGLIYLITIYKSRISTRVFEKPTKAIVKRLFSFGIPITITRLIASLVNAWETSLIPKQLKKAGHTLSAATSFYGELSGVAFTLLGIPSTLTFSLATTLIPAISEAESKHEKQLLRQRASEAIGITIIAGLPCGLILFYWGPLITETLFNVTQAGKLLKILALGSIFLYLQQTTNGILQGLGLVNIIILTTLISGTLKLGGIYLGGAHPLKGPSCIAFSYVISYCLTAALNLGIINYKINLKLQRGFFPRLLTAGLIIRLGLIHCYFLAKQSLLYLVFLTPTFVFLFLLLLFLTGDNYSQLLFQHLFRQIRGNLGS